MLTTCLSVAASTHGFYDESSYVHLLIAFICMHLIICIFLLDEFTCFMRVGLCVRYKVLIANGVFSNHTCKKKFWLKWVVSW